MMGMIIHTAEDEFVAHVFHCEPSAGGLCKIIEAACKVRSLTGVFYLYYLSENLQKLKVN